MNLICFHHPDYDGTVAPVLSCKTCCGLFVASIKARQAGAAPVDTQQWLNQKCQGAPQDATNDTPRETPSIRRANARYDFDPSSI